MITKTEMITARFGAISFTENDLLVLPDGMIGFPQLKNFVLIEHKPGSPFQWLQSIDEPAISFLIVAPGLYVQDYNPIIPSMVVEALEITEESPYLVYTVVSIPKGKPEEMSLNLAGPILINVETRKGAQVVLEDNKWALKHLVGTPKKSESQQAA